MSNSRTQDDMQKHAANCKPKHCQCGTSTSMSLGLWSLYTKNIFIRFFFWCLRLLNNSPQRMFRTNQWPPRCTDMEYGWDITAVPLAKEHLYGRIVLLHKNSALENWRRRMSKCFRNGHLKWMLKRSSKGQRYSKIIPCLWTDSITKQYAFVLGARSREPQPSLWPCLLSIAVGRRGPLVWRRGWRSLRPLSTEFKGMLEGQPFLKGIL